MTCNTFSVRQPRRYGEAPYADVMLLCHRCCMVKWNVAGLRRECVWRAAREGLMHGSACARCEFQTSRCQAAQVPGRAAAWRLPPAAKDSGWNTGRRQSRSRSIGWRRFIGGIALGAPRIRAINTLSKGIYSAYSPRPQGDTPDKPPRCPDQERIHRRTARLTYMDGFGTVRNSAESNVSNLISASRTLARAKISTTVPGGPRAMPNRSPRACRARIAALGRSRNHGLGSDAASTSPSSGVQRTRMWVTMSFRRVCFPVVPQRSTDVVG